MSPAKEEVTSAAAKAKKPSARRKPRPAAAPAHPSYIEMVTDAISVLKERTGSSQIAITKFLEEKHKGRLPPTFRKLLLVQLKKFTAAGKLTKVKNSYKLPPARPKAVLAAAKRKLKPKPAASPKPKAGTRGKAPVPAKPKTVVKAKPTPKSAAKPNAAAKPKAATKHRASASAAKPKPKPASRPTKVAKTSARASPAGKKAAAPVKKAAAPAKKATAAAAKKSKSVKATARKATLAKKAASGKKATAK